jgi:hypothetical protein
MMGKRSFMPKKKMAIRYMTFIMIGKAGESSGGITAIPREGAGDGKFQNSSAEALFGEKRKT